MVQSDMNHQNAKPTIQEDIKKPLERNLNSKKRTNLSVNKLFNRKEYNKSYIRKYLIELEGKKFGKFYCGILSKIKKIEIRKNLILEAYEKLGH